MPHHDDDDETVEGGPPPDPSLRSWRHPSEIAAAAGAAARAADPPRPPRHRTVAVAGTVLVVAAALVAVTQLRTTVDLTTEGAGEIGPAARATASPLSSLTAVTGPVTTDGRESVATVAPTFDGGRRPERLRADATSTTVDDVTATVNDVGGGTTGTVSGDPFDPMARPTDAAVGVFGADPSEHGLDRLAAFIVVEGMIFTSSSATDGHDQLLLHVADIWVDAQVLGRDPATDVAVLDVAVDDAPAFFGATADAASAGVGDDTAAGTGIELRLPGSDTTLEGVVIGADERTMSRSGAIIDGSLATTVRKPDGASGSALIDDRGFIIGLVVDSADYLTRAIPIDRVLDIGRSLIDWGLPALQWLGVTGTSDPAQGVILQHIDPEGPAATAELAPGDLVVEVDGEVVIDIHHLVYLIRRAEAGSTLDVTIERNGTVHHVEVTVGRRPEAVPSG